MELRTEIVINATPEQIWKVLLDFEKYPEWNPFLKSITGKAALGEKLVVNMHPSGGKPMTFKPVVKDFEQNRKFSWLGRLGMPYIFDGNHIFELTPAGNNQTRLIHWENFQGILVPFLKKMLNTTTKNAFGEMNEALKKRVEQG